MADTLEIPVMFKNEELTVKAHVVRYGYIQHIVVDLNGTPVTIERDEEGAYRALGYDEKIKTNKIDVGLVKAIVDVLQSL